MAQDVAGRAINAGLLGRAETNTFCLRTSKIELIPSSVYLKQSSVRQFELLLVLIRVSN